MRSFIAFIRFAEEYYELATGGMWTLASKIRRRQYINKLWREYGAQW